MKTHLLLTSELCPFNTKRSSKNFQFLQWFFKSLQLAKFEGPKIDEFSHSLQFSLFFNIKIGHLDIEYSQATII